MGYYMCSKISIKMNKKKIIIGKMIYLFRTKHKICPLYIPNNQQIGPSKKECNLAKINHKIPSETLSICFIIKKKLKSKGYCGNIS